MPVSVVHLQNEIKIEFKWENHVKRILPNLTSDAAQSACPISFTNQSVL